MMSLKTFAQIYNINYDCFHPTGSSFVIYPCLKSMRGKVLPYRR